MSFNVATVADLQKVGTGVDGWNMDSSYIQTADIDMVGETLGAEDKGIGTILDPFRGQYDGGGYRIYNLSLSDFQDVGMFSRVAGSFVLQNIKLTDVNIYGLEDGGGLIGRFSAGASGSTDNGTIYRCSVSGDVSGESVIGLLVGFAIWFGGDKPSLTIEECAVDGTVTPDLGEAGGLIGNTSYVTTNIINCYSRADIAGTVDEGRAGLVGWAEDVVNVTNSYAAGDVNGSGVRVAGLIGRMCTESSVSNSYYDTILSGQNDDDGRGEPRSTLDMTIPTYGAGTYTGWDFDDVWINDALGLNDYYPIFDWQVPKMAVTTVVGETIRSTFPFVKIIVVYLLKVTGADHLHFRLKSAKEDINTQDDRERFGYSMDGGSTYIQFPEDGIPAVNPYGLIVAANIEVPPAEVAGLAPYCKIMEGSGAGQWWDTDFATRDDWWSLGLGEGVTASAWEPIFEHEVEGV